MRKNSRHLLNQSDAKPKPMATWSHAIPRSKSRLRVFAWNFHWLVVLFCDSLWLLWLWLYDTQLKTALNTVALYLFCIFKSAQLMVQSNPY